MNDSFEVILNSEQFERYKQLQRNGELAAKALHELKRDIENYKLKAEQQELTLRGHELKIKELSKNSIRLSRRLIAEQEEHFNTQETFLAREKELLEKMLVLSNEQDNTAAYLAGARETKDRLEEENCLLKRKVGDLERVVERLNLEGRQAKKQQSSLQDRCTLVEGEFLAVSKECSQLKSKVQQLMSDSKQKERAMSENMRASVKASQLAQESRISQITSTYEERIRQCQNVYSEKVKDLTGQMKELNEKLHQKIEDFDLIYEQKERIQSQYDSLLLKNQNLFGKVNRLKLTIEGMKKWMTEQREQIELDLWNYKQSMRKGHEGIDNYLKKHQIQSKKREEQRKNQSKEQLMVGIWSKIEPQLSKIVQQLKKDSIAEWQIILTLQFNRVIGDLKGTLQKVLKQCFNAWLKK